MSCEENKYISLLICYALDILGYKQINISARSKCLDSILERFSADLERNGLPMTVLSVGSFGEGVNTSRSDMDQMLVFNDVICLDEASVDRHLTLLQSDYTDTAPGYTKVVLINMHTANPISMFLFGNPSMYISQLGYHYMSSEETRKRNYAVRDYLPRTWYDGLDTKYSMSENGPAVTNCIKWSAYDCEIDAVFSVYYYGGEYLRKWTIRDRLCGWPSSENVKEISEMEGYIVPVGHKQSENETLEWRICFTTAEKKLVSTLNDVQIKMYVLLKVVAKQFLKPVCKAITSYIVKNVVFWLLERTRFCENNPKHILNMLQSSLIFIKTCFENNHLPNYMIPERNLLGAVVSRQEKENIKQLLSELLEEGRAIILRIPNLYNFISRMVAIPEKVILYGTWRDQVEKQELIVIQHLYIDASGNQILKNSFIHDLFRKWALNENLRKAAIQLFDVLVPEWRYLIRSKKYAELRQLFRARQNATSLL